MAKKIEIKITNDEAIVLFEFLARFNEIEHPELFEDQAEQRVLWDIECILEKLLAEPFDPNWKDILQKARDAVRDEE